MTETTYLYRQYDKAGQLLYIGISCSFMARITKHAFSSSWFPDVNNINIEKFESRELAALAERTAIKKEKPMYNRTNIKTKRNSNEVLIGAMFPPVVRRSLALLQSDERQEGKTIKDLLTEALSDLLKKYGYPGISIENE